MQFDQLKRREFITLLGGAVGMDGERVDAAFELTDKCFVDHAVALDPALPAERLRHNMHPEMSLPALASSSVRTVTSRARRRGVSNTRSICRGKLARHNRSSSGARIPRMLGKTKWVTSPRDRPPSTAP